MITLFNTYYAVHWYKK